MLFDRKSRITKANRYHFTSDYDFCNNSNHDVATNARKHLRAYLRKFPLKNVITNRMKSNDENGFWSAFMEIYLYYHLHGVYQMSVEPNFKNKKPDFTVFDRQECVLEAKFLNDPYEDKHMKRLITYFEDKWEQDVGLYFQRDENLTAPLNPKLILHRVLYDYKNNSLMCTPVPDLPLTVKFVNRLEGNKVQINSGPAVIVDYKPLLQAIRHKCNHYGKLNKTFVLALATDCPYYDNYHVKEFVYSTNGIFGSNQRYYTRLSGLLFFSMLQPHVLESNFEYFPNPNAKFSYDGQAFDCIPRKEHRRILC